ncbi:MAG: hypothetical protein AAFR61_09090 [Bacteroidota bacterium]
MNIRQSLIDDRSKANMQVITQYVLDNPSAFKEFMDCLLSEDEMIANRAAWAYSDIAMARPEWLEPYMEALIGELKAERHQGIHRNILRGWRDYEFNDEYGGEVAEICFDFLQNPQETIAVRVFAMVILHNLTRPYPELGRELALIVEEHMPFGSAGFKSRGNKVLKDLKKRGLV